MLLICVGIPCIIFSPDPGFLGEITRLSGSNSRIDYLTVDMKLLADGNHLSVLWFFGLELYLVCSTKFMVHPKCLSHIRTIISMCFSHSLLFIFF